MNAKNTLRREWQPYAVAIALVAAAVALRRWPLHTLGASLAWLTFYPAVAFAALYGGFPAGLLGTFLSCIAVFYLWPLFADRPFIQTSASWLGLAVFLITCTVISLIAEAMHRARARVKEVNEELEAANIKLQEKIAERKQAEAAIRELNESLQLSSIRLEVANKELEAFSYSVAHDLRAPLRHIDGFSRALLEDYGEKLDAQGKDHVQRVRMASQRMAQLIDDLLNLSRISRGEMERGPVDLSELARGIAEELLRTHPERQADFVISKGLAVNGDKRLLRVVLENLLGNAWKFTGKKSRARIEFGVAAQEGLPAVQAGSPVYFVRDNGAGFEMAYADKLFGAFQRLHHLSDFPGTGIGLATVQRIIHRHGGRVWAEGAVEQGATFYFTF